MEKKREEDTCGVLQQKVTEEQAVAKPVEDGEGGEGIEGLEDGGWEGIGLPAGRLICYDPPRADRDRILSLTSIRHSPARRKVGSISAKESVVCGMDGVLCSSSRAHR